MTKRLVGAVDKRTPRAAVDRINWAIFLLLTGGFIGTVATVLFPYGPILVGCAVVGTSLVLRAPTVLVPIAFLLCSSPITSAGYLPRVPMGWFSLEIQDFFLVFLLAVTVGLAMLRSRRVVWHKLDIVLLAFSLTAGLGSVVALLRGVQLMVTLRQLLIVLAVPTMYWFVRLLGRGSARAGDLFVRQFLWVGFLSGLINVVQYVLSCVGSTMNIVAAWTVSQRTSSLLTLRTPSQGLLLISTALWCYLLLAGDRRLADSSFPRPRVILALMTGLGFLVQFARSAFLGLAVVVGLTAFLVGCEGRVASVLRGGLIVGVLMGIVIFAIPSDSLDWILRVLTPGGMTRDPSAAWRLTELSYAFLSFYRHPVLGIGLGSDYRPPVYLPENPVWGTQGTNYVHSAPVWWVTDTGLVGLAVLVAILLILARALLRPSTLKTGIAIGLLGHGVSTLAAPSWMASTADGVVIGALLGVLATLEGSGAPGTINAHPTADGCHGWNAGVAWIAEQRALTHERVSGTELATGDGG